MKRTLTTLMMAMGLVGVFVATPVSAQTPAVAEIPFSFVVSGKTLPAGQYNISQFAANSATFSLRKSTGEAVFGIFGARQNGHPADPSVTFKKVDNAWVMYEVAPPDSQTAYSLSLQAFEKNRHMELATMVSIKLR